ncbi:hypothetical protein [Candidatus Liberibacter sp.]|uniref:hypothetical protein n=1 Tax=Candidatus Liberibacter sp. TaxID=34022 RepID=UPI0015F76723|nr:hypothetical protein [Candidatus Liberibacter sp.]MBA5723589.1 hypothetical protein [Candidatus Liberibacter sp.]
MPVKSLIHAMEQLQQGVLMSTKGRIDIKNVARIAKEIKIHIEIEKDNRLYKFESFKIRGERVKIDFP